MASMVPFNRYNTAIDAPVRFYDMLDDFFNFPAPSSSIRRSLAADTFKIDVIDDEKGYTIEAELPGIAKEDINLEFDNDQLTIAINHTEEKDESKPEKHYVHKERRQVSMSRSIYLHDINADGITAKLEDGVLTVEVPKKVAEDNAKKILIG